MGQVPTRMDELSMERKSRITTMKDRLLPVLPIQFDCKSVNPGNFLFSVFAIFGNVVCETLCILQCTSDCSTQPTAADHISMPDRLEQTLLYQLVEEYYPRLLDILCAQGRSLPVYAQNDFDDYLKCGRLVIL